VTEPAGRLSIAVAAILVVGIGLGGVLALRGSQAFADEHLQALNRSMAMYVAARGPLLSAPGVANAERLREIAAQAMTLNPAATLYLLDVEGQVLWPPPASATIRSRLALDPIRRFLATPAGASLLTRGDDPRDPARRRPAVFSAAPVESQGAIAGYVYVVLDGAAAASRVDALHAISASQTLRYGSWALCALAALGGLAAWATTAWLTRPLSRLHRRIIETGRALIANLEPAATVRSPPGDLAAVQGAVDALAQRVGAQLHELRSLDELRRELYAQVSHDLRTPLTALRGYLETLAAAETRMTPAERGEFVAVALRHCARLQRLVDQAFMLARLERAAWPLHREALPLGELAQDLAEKWRVTASATQRSLRIELAVGVPCVLADVALLETVIENLLDNALRHGAAGGAVLLSIQQTRAGRIRCCVQDEGPGIGSEDLERVRRGVRAGTGGGIGLGLAIVQRALALHDSTLEITSGTGLGTRMAFELEPHRVPLREDSVRISQPVSA
jgi:signal transduction histidine kinase